MGGPGSGRKAKFLKKKLVEDCVAVLDANQWMQMGLLKRDITLASQLELGSLIVQYEVDCTDLSDPSLALFYRAPQPAKGYSSESI